MGSDGVETNPEVVEFSLLAADVLLWRSSRLVLERAVHALVPAVLAGASRLDPDRLDAELEPPNRKPGKAVEALRGEWDAIVCEDLFW